MLLKILVSQCTQRPERKRLVGRDISVVCTKRFITVAMRIASREMEFILTINIYFIEKSVDGLMVQR